MPAEIPNEVDAPTKTGYIARVEQRIGRSVQYIQRFDATERIPIETIKGHLVRRLVGDVQVDVER